MKVHKNGRSVNRAIAMVALTLFFSSASSTDLLHRLFRNNPISPSVTLNSYLFLRPLRIPTKSHKPYLRPKPLLITPRQSFPLFPSSPSSSILSSRSISSLYARSFTDSALQVQEADEKKELADDPLSALHEEDEEEEEEEEEVEVEEGSFLALAEEEDGIAIEKIDDSNKSLLKSLHDPGNGGYDEGVDEKEGFLDTEGYCVEKSEVGLSNKNERGVKSVPKLTVKEKKELASYAHSLGKKLKCQLVGKSGVTDTFVSSFDETLEKYELVKIKVLRNCPDELEDVVRYLEKATGSVVVDEIGRTVILYRPSFTKLKSLEKREESQRVFTRRTSKLRPGSLVSNKSG